MNFMDIDYIDIDSFVIHIKTEDFYEDIADRVEKWFDTSNYSKDDNRLLPIGKNKKVIGRFKDELVQTNMLDLEQKHEHTYWMMIVGITKLKEQERVIKIDLMLKNYKDYSFNNKIILKSQQRFKSDHHDVYTEQINKIALSSTDDKR